MQALSQLSYGPKILNTLEPTTCRHRRPLSQLSYGPRDGKHTEDLRRGSTEGRAALSHQRSALSHQPESIKPVPDGVARLCEPPLNMRPHSHRSSKRHKPTVRAASYASRSSGPALRTPSLTLPPG